MRPSPSFLLFRTDPGASSGASTPDCCRPRVRPPLPARTPPRSFFTRLQLRPADALAACRPLAQQPPPELVGGKPPARAGIARVHGLAADRARQRPTRAVAAGARGGAVTVRLARSHRSDGRLYFAQAPPRRGSLAPRRDHDLLAEAGSALVRRLPGVAELSAENAGAVGAGLPGRSRPCRRLSAAGGADVFTADFDDAGSDARLLGVAVGVAHAGGHVCGWRAGGACVGAEQVRGDLPEALFGGPRIGSRGRASRGADQRLQRVGCGAGQVASARTIRRQARA